MIAQSNDLLDANHVVNSEQLELTIVMPCLNEAETLGVCIRKAKDFLERSGIAGEVLIGDNGSTDGSQDIARRLGARSSMCRFAAMGQPFIMRPFALAASMSLWATPMTATTFRT